MSVEDHTSLIERDHHFGDIFDPHFSNAIDFDANGAPIDYHFHCPNFGHWACHFAEAVAVVVAAAVATAGPAVAVVFAAAAVGSVADAVVVVAFVAFFCRPADCPVRCRAAANSNGYASTSRDTAAVAWTAQSLVPPEIPC